MKKTSKKTLASKYKLELDLHTPLSKLSGVGTATIKNLQAKKLYTIKDILNLIPKKYKDTTKILTISQVNKLLENLILDNPMQNNTATSFSITKCIKGVLQKKSLITTPRKKLKLIELHIIEHDPNIQTSPLNKSTLLLKKQQKLIVHYFNQAYLYKMFQEGKEYIFFGKISKQNNKLYMTNPEFEKFKPNLQKFGKIIPIYVANSKYLTNTKIRKLLYQTIPVMNSIQEFIPDIILKQNNIHQINQAYINIHFPKQLNNIQPAYERLQIQEILELINKEHNNQKHKSDINLPDISITKLQKFIKTTQKSIEQHLHITLTNDQQQALLQLISAINSKKHSIFLYGDVGAGKTIVFLIIASALINQGFNVFLMAPTKILSQQHYQNALNLFKLLNLDKNLQLVLSNKSSVTNKPSLYIGTSALINLQDSIQNIPTALVGIDEEHRFGVIHRKLLQHSAQNTTTPFLLSMSATPIPRTLARTFYGYNASIYINQTPFSKNITTKISSFNKIPTIMLWLKQQFEQKKQAYIVVPRISSENYDITIETMQELLTPFIKPYKLETLHGQIPSKKQNQIIKDFKDNKIQVILATSLIEVGIDSPNASIILILGAEMFGLAQLHQLRGRVGRRGQKSYCIVIPSLNAKETAIQRLKKFTQITDGLKLAQLDLEYRGPGIIFGGPKQTGWNQTKIANLKNYYIIQKSLKIYEQLQQQNIIIPNIILEKPSN